MSPKDGGGLWVALERIFLNDAKRLVTEEEGSGVGGFGGGRSLSYYGYIHSYIYS